MEDHSTLSGTPAAARATDKVAAAELLPLLYGELRKLGQAMMRRQPGGHTLQATALVHEAYAKMVGDADPGWDGRAHFFGAAAQAMREILVDQARRKAARKRGGDRQRNELHEVYLPIESPVENVLAFEEVLQKLERQDPKKAKTVVLRLFGGLTVQEIATTLGVSKSTVERDWRYIRAWLYKELDDFGRGLDV
jgi:RNA polymerase sigma factor (TIGR02999 family)